MADETETEIVVLTQPEGERLALDHAGSVALHGDDDCAPMRHDVGARLTHVTERPLVHMVCWDEDDLCRVQVEGRVTLAGDEKAPLHVTMAHRFENDHRQTHRIEPVDHTMHLPTALASPIHHALQMRTPLQLRFCNPWHIASDYTVEVTLGERRLWSVRLTGATVATPQPCADDDCPPAVSHPGRP
jgi:hypothetical protein